MKASEPTVTSPVMSPSVDPNETAPGRVNGDVIAEVIFLAIVGVVFLYFLIASSAWPIGAALLPRLAALVGLPLLAIHIYQRLRPGKGPKRQILDMGFTEEGISAADVRSRTVRMLGSMVALFVGIWLVGFHIALPLYVFLYLILWAGAKWYWALVAAAFFEALLIGLYDNTLHMAWNEPVLLKLLGLR